jgi:type IV secretion system protein VirB4
MQDSQQNNVEIHQSLVRPVLIAGVERELAILIGISSVLIWIAGKDFMSFLLAIAIWFIGMFLAREAAKLDGQMVKVFLRHIQYQEFYQATENPEENHSSRERRNIMQGLLGLIKKKEVGIPSLIPYFMLMDDEGIMLNKDGSFLTGFYYHPPDMGASGGSEKDSLCDSINEALGLLGTGWLIHVDLIKIPVRSYGLNNTFTAPMLHVLEQERKNNFEEGNHFEIVYALTLTYKSPAVLNSDFQKIFITNPSNHTGMSQLLNEFRQRTAEIEAALGNHLTIRRMNSKELLGYLHYCITGQFVSLDVPQYPGFLNHYLASYEFTAGIAPKIDEQYIGVVAMTGFPQSSMSGLMEFLQSLPFEFRFSSRFLFLDPVDGENHLRKVLIKWHNKQMSLRDLILEIVAPGSESQYGNVEAANKAADAHQAITLAQEGNVKFGYYTPVIVVMSKDKTECRTRLEIIRDALRARSCLARIETINAVESFRGSLPGDSLCNVRQPLIHTLNLSHFLPLQGIWTGEEANPNPKLPKESPPLFLASTIEGMPFRFNNHVEDVGHALLCGPTGAGKTSLLALISTQFLRYSNAKVFYFDRKYGFYALSLACAARHYEILGDENSVMFCPLQQIQSTSEMIWAAGWMEELIRLQGVTITPEKRQTIRQGLEALKADKIKSLSNYYMIIQDREIRGALEPFIKVKDGVMASLMDGENDSVLDGCLQVFETGKLFQVEPRYVVPVLLYLFHQIDRQLTGQPTLIAIDEAWLILQDQVFVRFLKEWLRELRKSNGCVVFCTQHVSDILDSPVKDVIIESTPVKIFLPNSHAVTPTEEQSYLKLGLTPTDIRLIASAIPKKHYYYTSPLGKRLIDLELSPAFLSFMGKSNMGDIRQVKSLQKEFPETWPAEWLRIHNLNEQASLWEEMNKGRKENRHDERQISPRVDQIDSNYFHHRDLGSKIICRWRPDPQSIRHRIYTVSKLSEATRSDDQTGADGFESNSIHQVSGRTTQEHPKFGYQ